MAHHSSDTPLPEDDLNELTGEDEDLPEGGTAEELREALGVDAHGERAPDAPSPDDTELGPTGEYPDGKVSSADEGGITLAVTDEDGTVFINLGSPVKALGLTPEQAKSLGGALLNHARNAK